MAKYLVTGGAGFIGSNIVAQLIQQGETVRVLDNFSTGHIHNLAPLHGHFELCEGDIREPSDCAAATAGMDYVLHQAALGSVPRSLANPVETHTVNVTGTLNMLMAARDAAVKRLVFASSSSVYGDQDVAFKHEDLPLQPRSPYAASKAACELNLRAFSESFGMETITLRYFNVFGPHQDPDSPYSAVVPLFIRALLRGEAPTIHGDGEQARDFTYVDNVVAANLLAATAAVSPRGRVFNVACGDSWRIVELLAQISAVMEKSAVPLHGPPRPGDVYVSKASIARIEAELGYQPTWTFQAGLEKTVAWYRSRGA